MACETHGERDCWFRHQKSWIWHNEFVCHWSLRRNLISTDENKKAAMFSLKINEYTLRERMIIMPEFYKNFNDWADWLKMKKRRGRNTRENATRQTSATDARNKTNWRLFLYPNPRFFLFFFFHNTTTAMHDNGEESEAAAQRRKITRAFSTMRNTWPQHSRYANTVSFLSGSRLIRQAPPRRTESDFELARFLSDRPTLPELRLWNSSGIPTVRIVTRSQFV